jgi:hypothetical protein
MFLPDVNFWLALTFATHQFHPSAKRWFDGLRGPVCYLCRHTQHGFFRLANNPRVMQAAAVPMAEAWRLYELVQSDERVGFADEPPGLDAVWHRLTNRQSFSPQLWSDAYVAAFAQRASWEVVTFDQGFTQFPALKVTLLA